MGFKEALTKGPVRNALSITAFLLLVVAPASAQTVSLSSGVTIPMVGGTGNVLVSVDSITDGLGVDLDIMFDPTVVTVANPGSDVVLTGIGVSSNCQSPTANVQNTNLLKISVVCFQPPTLNGSGAFLQITFTGVATGTSPLTFPPQTPPASSCVIDEEPCDGTVDGDVSVLGPTNTPTATPTITPTSTNSPTPSQTPTITNTATVTPTNTQAPTPTVTPTFTVTPTASETPTITPTATVTPTFTNTATPTNTPIPVPRITSGNVANETRVFGVGAGNVPQGSLLIFSAGPNGTPEGGGGDDQQIGSGGTDPSGNFNDGANGIGLTRGLVANELIFAVDQSNGLVGPPVTVSGPRAPIPTLTGIGTFVLAGLLALALLWRTGPLRRRFDG